MARSRWLAAVASFVIASSGPAPRTQDPAIVEDGAAGAVVVELVADRGSYFVDEVIRLRLRIGIDDRFLRDNLLAMFRQTIDVPVQLDESALLHTAGLVRLDAEDSARAVAATGPSFAAGDRIVHAERADERVVDGRRFRLLEVTRAFRCERVGELVLPSPRVRFAFATRFRDDFLEGRVAEDRADGVARGTSLTLSIRPLPDEGRPATFSGAVGRFTVEADASPLELVVGSSLKLVLRITGDGDLAQFSAPRLDALDGFHVFGSVEERAAARRTITYDLAPRRADLRELPGVAFTFFDPAPPAAYRSVVTPAIPLVVHPSPSGTQLPPIPTSLPKAVVPGEDDIFELMPFVGGRPGGTARDVTARMLVLAIAGPWLCAIGFLALQRARRRALADPLGVRARRAARVFLATTSRDGDETATAFAEYVAARLRCPSAAVIDAALASRLVGARVPEPLASRASHELERLTAARYSGGPPVAAAVATARELVDELETVFVSLESER